MPVYSFINTTTNVEFEETMSYEDKVIFLEENDDIESVIGRINFAGDGGLKHTSDFRRVLQKVKKAHPGGTIDTGNITEV